VEDMLSTTPLGGASGFEYNALLLLLLWHICAGWRRY